MKDILRRVLFLVTFCLVLFETGVAQTFYESFDGCAGVGGNDGYWNKTSSGGNVVADNEGWKFDGASIQANKCARLGSSSVAGYATTPALGIEGDATLTFRAGPWTGWALELEITIPSGGGRVETKKVTMVEEAFTQYTINLYGLSASSKIRIASTATKQGRFFLDDVRVVPKKPVLADITLSGDNQEDDNSEIIKENIGKDVNVKLQRTMKADGGWYTLCLPFKITAEDITEVLGGAKVETMKSLRTNDDITEIVFMKAESVEAGEPFIICPLNDISNVVFTAKTIEVEEATVVTLSNTLGQYSFCGIFSPVNLKTDGTERFLSSDGRSLTKPKGDSRLKALRAYFIVPSSDEEVTIVTSSDTGIENIHVSLSDVNGNIFDLQGRRIRGDLPAGVYIINGKKVVIR